MKKLENMKMLRYLLLIFLVLIVSSCAQSPGERQASRVYPKKSSESGRNPIRQMVFLEQAEEDADLDDVIVIPPGKKEPPKQE